MADDKQVRKVARCIKTLLEVEGVNVTSTKVMDLIQDKDLSDIPALKDEVVSAINDMRSEEEAQRPAVVKPDRRKQIETFCVTNWDSIQDNQFVRDALLNAYSQGRYTKEQRQQLKNELLAICNGDTPEEVDTPVANETALADDANAELAASLMGGGTSYDF